MTSASRGYTGTTSTRTLISLSSLEQARRIAALAQEKLAEDVVILDMRPVCTFTDYFVIATGRNPRQTAAIWDEVHGRMKQRRAADPARVRRDAGGTWILADYLDVVLHVFTPEAREYYKLEELWNDVPAVELDDRRQRASTSAGLRAVARQQEIRRRAGQAAHGAPAERDRRRACGRPIRSQTSLAERVAQLVAAVRGSRGRAPCRSGRRREPRATSEPSSHG